MIDQPKKDYRQLLTEVIKKQMIILGPDITLAKARNVKGLKVEDSGNVTEMSGAPQELIQELINQFVQLSGLIVQKTMEPLLAGYPQDQLSNTVVDNVRAQIQTNDQKPEDDPKNIIGQTDREGKKK